MKLFKSKLKKNNKGMTLVEVICSVAILGLATSAVGGAMVVSAKSYQRNTIEFEVQQEVQTTTNLIGNMVVDAKTANWDPDTKTLTVSGNGLDYTIIYDESTKTLNYFQNDGTETITGVLAENVANFDIDDSMFDTSKSVKVDLQVVKDDKVYTAAYNTTARNGEVSNVLEAGSFARIEIERDVVLEPNQTYEFPVELKNISMEQAGGLAWNFDNADGKAYCSGNDNKASITLKPEAEGTFQFTVSTVNNKKNEDGSDSGVPLATRTVTVKVRRVTGMDELNPAITVAAPATKNAVYEFVSHVTGDNLLVDLGAQYDDDYKNPNFVKFTAEISGQPDGKTVNDYIDVLSGYENQNSPMFKIKIKETIPTGAKVTIKATAKHPEGVLNGDGGFYNKASQDAKDAGEANPKRYYDSVFKTYDIIGADIPGNTPPISFPAGLERGNDYVFITTFNPTEVGANGVSIKQEFGGEPQYFVRFKEEGGNWTQYYATEEEGVTKKIAAEETRLMLVDKAYDIDIIVIMVDGKAITWPHDTSLLDSSCGFITQGYYQGWTAEDLTSPNSATSHDQYGAYHQLGATEAVFYNNVYDPSDDFLGIAEGVFVKRVGDQGNNKEIVLSQSGADSKPNSMKVYFDMINLDQGQYKKDGNAADAFKPVVYKYDSTTNSWGEPLDDYGMHIQTGNEFFLISQLQNADVGYYRIGIAIDEYYTTVQSVNGNMVPSYKDDNANEWKIFDENDKDGFMYIKIVD